MPHFPRLPIIDKASSEAIDHPIARVRTRELNGSWLDPLKTTIVQGQRAMTTWVMRKIAD